MDLFRFTDTEGFFMLSLGTLVVAYCLISATLFYWDLYKTYRLPVDIVCALIPLICLGGYTYILWPR